MECAACGTDDELVYRCERCLGIFCATHHDHRYHDCTTTLADPTTRDGDPTGESTFLWGEHLTPTTASEWIWGSADASDPAEGAAQESSSDAGDTFEAEPSRREQAAETAAGPASVTASGSGTEAGADAAVNETPASEGAETTADTGVAEPADSEGPATAADSPVTDSPTATGAAATPASPSSPVDPVSGPHQDHPEIPQEASRPGYGPEPFSADPVGPPTTFTEWLRRQTYLSLTVKVGIVASLFNLLAYSLIAVAMVLSLG